MAGTLHIHLLDHFRLLLDDDPLTGVDAPRLQSLLAYLLLHRDAPQSRAHLSFLFWPDSTESQARTNLRKQLYHLRQGLPDADYFLHADSTTIHWRAEDRFTLDVAQFEHALDESEKATETGDDGGRLAALNHAVSVYTGPLLPECYDEWVLPERERLQRRAMAALQELADLLEAQRRYEEAAWHTQRLLDLDPVHERAYRQLMRLLALQGNRAAAIRTYHTCVTVLQDELEVAPDAATQRLYHNLLEFDTPEPDPPARPVHIGQFRPAWPLVGRNAEWAQIREAWEELLAGGQHLILVTGEAGIGKTRLAEEFAAWARRQGIATAMARCYATGRGLAYGPVSEWLRSARLQPALRALAPLWLTEAARLLPELLVERADIPHPQPMTEAWQRQHLFEALALPFAAQRRLVLLIDDIPWADRETLEWLSYLLHRTPRTEHLPSLMLIATARTEDLMNSEPLQRLVDELRRAGQISEIALEPLTGDESLALAAEVAGQPIDPLIATSLYRETEGNPLFVVEMVRAALARPDNGGHPLRQDGRRSDLPPAVHSAILSRLAHLSPEARSLAEKAATLGRQVAFDVLAQMASRDGDPVAEDRLVRALDELWQRRIVRQSSATDYDFAHDKIRQVVYHDLSPARKRQLHRHAARALRRVHAGSLDAVSGQIAQHYERGGLQRQAIDYYRRAGEVARRVYANEEAVGIYQHLLDSDLSALLTRDEVCATMLALADVWQLTGNWQASEQMCRQALATAEAEGNVQMAARCHYSLGNLVRYQGAYDDALSWLGMARKGFESSGDKRGLVRALWAIGEVYWYMGDQARALEALERQMSIATDTDDRRAMSDAASTMGTVYWSLGEFERARALCLQAIEIAEEINHWRGVGRALITLGNTHNNEGNLAPAFTAYEQAFEVARQIGDRQSAASALANTGQIYHLANDDHAALTCYHASLRTALELGDRWVVSIALANMAKITALLGHTDSAGELYEKAITLARALGANYLGEYLLSFAQFCERQGRLELAKRLNDEVLQIASERPDKHMGGVDTLFSSQLLAVRLQYALGRSTLSAAVADLSSLLPRCANDTQRARVHYEMWQLDPSDQARRHSASILYRQLDPATLRGQDRRRYIDVTGEELPPLPLLPDPADIVGKAPEADDTWLAQVDQLLAELDTDPHF